MRVRSLVYLCVLMSCDVPTHTASMKDSGEQSALQEALLLVELLKSEYARVLREKSLIKENEIDKKDLETCATTIAPDAVRDTRTFVPIRHIEQTSTTETLEPYTGFSSRGSHHPKYFPRRRFNKYQDYYENYGQAKPFRRMDNGNQSTTVSVSNSPTESTLPSVLNTSSTNISETLSDISSSSTTPKSIALSVTNLKPTNISTPTTLSSTTLSTLTSLINNKQPISISKPVSIRSSVTTAKNKNAQTKKRSVSEKVKLKHKKLSHSMNKTTITSTYEPEKAQVAAELENELEAAIASSTSLPSSSSRRWPLTWRPSTKLYLARSTPYILPLPENHAFCYTNPKSSLCRTFIK